MACLNCTTRVLRLFLHANQLPLRPLPLLRTAGLQRVPAYARLAIHLTARKQSTLATLGGELTDDDYVPFDYHLARTVPAAIGTAVQSGWPPPVPEVRRMESEPDIELTSPHGEGAAWWDGVEELAAVEEGEGKKMVGILKREAYWTLDGGEQTYSLTPKNNKGKRKREREERERLAAAAAALAPAEEIKEVDVAVVAPAVEETTAIAGEEKTDTAEGVSAKEGEEVDGTTNNSEADSAEGSETASAKAARKAARKAWEEKKAAREAKIALKEARKAEQSLEKNRERRKRRAAEREAAGIATAETEGDSSKTHKYDQFFSDTRKATSTEHTPQAPRAPREHLKSSKDQKSALETPRAPPRLTLQKQKRFGAAPDVLEGPESLETDQYTNKWDLQIPETDREPTRLQKWVATAPRDKVEPWHIYKARLQAKFKGQAWAPPKKLSPDAQEAIRVLRKNHPEITTKMLADKFEVSGEAIRRILKSRWREQVKTPEKAQEWAEKWAKRGEKVFQRWEEAGIVTTKKKKMNTMDIKKVLDERLKAERLKAERLKAEKVPTVNTSSVSDRLL